jgi:hypothetical protein
LRLPLIITKYYFAVHDSILGLSGCWSINGGFPPDDRLPSIVIGAGAVTSHATTGGTTRHRDHVEPATLPRITEAGSCPTASEPIFQTSCISFCLVVEAARHLARFTEEVQHKRKSPLIASAPRQKAATTKRPLPIRSRQIAAQLLAHIPTSNRSEVLLTKKMGIVLPAAPVSSAFKGAYDAIFAGKLMSSQVAAFDELSPATNNRAGRKSNMLFSDAGVGSRSQHRRRLAS